MGNNGFIITHYEPGPLADEVRDVWMSSPTGQAVQSDWTTGNQTARAAVLKNGASGKHPRANFKTSEVLPLGVLNVTEKRLGL